MLTKVDTLTNTNERINLTIFESNDKPHTYATNLHFAGTGKCPMNNILATIGSNLSTAMRFFRQAFQEKTGCNWDDRLKAHNERVLARKSDTPRRGENASIKSKTRAAEDAMPFEGRFFEYMPPSRSSRGLLPDGKDQVPEVVQQMRAGPVAIDLTDDEPTAIVPESADPVHTVESDMTEKDDFNKLFGEASPFSEDYFIGADAGSPGIGGLLAGASEWLTQGDESFDATTLTKVENEFNFPNETQADQTQLAVGVGEDLLNLNKRKHDDSEDADEEAPVAKKPATEHAE